jgi:integrase/recombinase XerD
METETALTDPIESFGHYLLTERGLSRNTLEAYTRDIRKFAAFIEEIAKTSFRRVRPGDIVEYMITQKRKGMAINSLARNVVAIKMFFRYLAAEKTIEMNVADEIDTPRLWKHLPEILTVEQVNDLTDMPDTATAGGVRDRAIIEMLYATGMRISEVVDLNLNQFDPVEQFVICRGKGSRERVIPVGGQATEWTNKYLRDTRPKLSRNKKPPELFITRLGGKFTRQGMWKLLRKYMDRLGLEKKVTPHTLRHTFATHLLENGADIRVIQAMMGHSNISTTQLYTHVDTNRLKTIHKKYHPRG